MTTTWNDSFVETLREQIPQLPATGELSPTADLYNLGLDSMGSVQLLLALEEALDITIPDELLTADSFRTVTNIWELVQAAQSDQNPCDSGSW
ncbi:phosphopantetheine-binding protein [Micromonospora sp. NPDC049240]|uniref:phosphopantetheine-binding protein n=1 Tax=Micromonospora sp. NPDC049240 TaxID=3155151 RepID=UPI0033E9707B